MSFFKMRALIEPKESIPGLKNIYQNITIYVSLENATAVAKKLKAFLDELFGDKESLLVVNLFTESISDEEKTKREIDAIFDPELPRLIVVENTDVDMEKVLEMIRKSHDILTSALQSRETGFGFF